MSALRSASGLLTFVVAFALKRSGQPVALFGVVALAVTLASFAGTFVSPVLRRHVVDEHVILGACVALAAAGAVAAIALEGFSGMLTATITLALAASSAGHAFDSLLQRNVDERQRSRVFARVEALLEVAWVIGALVPTVLNLDVTPGYLGLVALCLASGAALVRAGARRPSASRS
jgi:predicted MFS family arabinose efflux permease